MQIALCTDAWKPQVNGVVKTLQQTVAQLAALGHQVRVLEPSMFPNMPCPLYPEINLSLPYLGTLQEQLDNADAVHIATEGPLGLAANLYCTHAGIPFSTSYTTNFADYLQKYLYLPPNLTVSYLSWFHQRARRVMVSTSSMLHKLSDWGVRRLRIWSRGVDTSLFRPRERASRTERVLLYVGRVAAEKNLDAFLHCQVSGQKWVVGDGPDRLRLQQRYPRVRFLGYLHGEALSQAYSDADVFVFPSKTDTFGLVIIEALACGVPVAAYPVPGPRDIITDRRLGALAPGLAAAIEAAHVSGEPECCRRHACEHYSWANSSRQFLDNLVVR